MRTLENYITYNLYSDTNTYPGTGTGTGTSYFSYLTPRRSLYFSNDGTYYKRIYYTTGSLWEVPTDTSTDLYSDFSDNLYRLSDAIVWNDPLTPAQRMKEILRSRSAPAVITSRWRPVSPLPNPQETRARETLRKVAGEDKFRQFLKRGFVTLRAKSGKVYQIFPGSKHTKVYDSQGNPLEDLCVVLPTAFPPTDSLIVRFLMILNDEQDFRNRCNIWQATGRKKNEEPPDGYVSITYQSPPNLAKTLPDMMRELKAKVA